MSTYGLLLSVHVTVAILGVGQLAALAVVAGKSPESAALLRLLRNARVALLFMFLSGAALEFTSGGAWHEQWWFRGSVLLMVLTGVLSRWTSRAVSASRWQIVQRTAWVMCGSVGIITALMELKPQ